MIAVLAYQHLEPLLTMLANSLVSVPRHQSHDSKGNAHDVRARQQEDSHGQVDIDRAYSITYACCL